MSEIHNDYAVPPWNYRSEPPYEVIATAPADDTLLAWHEFKSLSEATAWFVRFQVGPMSERVAGVIDGHKQILVGYWAPGEEGAWFGTEEGFAELARHHPPVVVLDWELQARDGNQPPPQIPQDVVQPS